MILEYMYSELNKLRNQQWHMEMLLEELIKECEEDVEGKTEMSEENYENWWCDMEQGEQIGFMHGESHGKEEYAFHMIRKLKQIKESKLNEKKSR